MSDLTHHVDAQVDAPASVKDRTTEQKDRAQAWRNHPVDVPASIGGFYFRMVIGRERRSKERRKQDRDNRQLGTIGNMLFAGSISGVVFSVVIVVVLVYSSILSE